MRYLFDTIATGTKGHGKFAVFQLEKSKYVCKCISWKEYYKVPKLKDLHLERVKGKWIGDDKGYDCLDSLISSVEEYYNNEELGKP